MRGSPRRGAGAGAAPAWPGRRPRGDRAARPLQPAVFQVIGEERPEAAVEPAPPRSTCSGRRRLGFDDQGAPRDPGRRTGRTPAGVPPAPGRRAEHGPGVGQGQVQRRTIGRPPHGALQRDAGGFGVEAAQVGEPLGVEPHGWDPGQDRRAGAAPSVSRDGRAAAGASPLKPATRRNRSDRGRRHPAGPRCRPNILTTARYGSGRRPRRMCRPPPGRNRWRHGHAPGIRRRALSGSGRSSSRRPTFSPGMRRTSGDAARSARRPARAVDNHTVPASSVRSRKPNTATARRGLSPPKPASRSHGRHRHSTPATSGRVQPQPAPARRGAGRSRRTVRFRAADAERGKEVPWPGKTAPPARAPDSAGWRLSTREPAPRRAGWAASGGPADS